MSPCLPSISFIPKGIKIPGPKVTCLRSHNQLIVELELVLRSFLGVGRCYLRSIIESIKGSDGLKELAKHLPNANNDLLN